MDNKQNQSILGTFLSGSLGIITIFFLALIIIPFAPLIVFIGAVIYLVWIFISPILKKQTQEISNQTSDDDT